MFAKGASLPPSALKSLAFHLSYMEVYKDDVFDLFVERASVSREQAYRDTALYKFSGFEASDHDK
jgi:hypothetical protein